MNKNLWNVTTIWTNGTCSHATHEGDKAGALATARCLIENCQLNPIIVVVAEISSERNAEIFTPKAFWGWNGLADGILPQRMTR